MEVTRTQKNLTQHEEYKFGKKETRLDRKTNNTGALITLHPETKDVTSDDIDEFED